MPDGGDSETSIKGPQKEEIVFAFQVYVRHIPNEKSSPLPLWDVWPYYITAQLGVG